MYWEIMYSKSDECSKYTIHGFPIAVDAVGEVRCLVRFRCAAKAEKGGGEAQVGQC